MIKIDQQVATAELASFTDADVSRVNPAYTVFFILRPGRTPATTLLSVQPMKIELYNRNPSSE